MNMMMTMVSWPEDDSDLADMVGATLRAEDISFLILKMMIIALTIVIHI